MEDLGSYHGRTRPRRSKAWVFYSIITVLLLIGSLAGQVWLGFLFALATGLYARYLYRGGRFVLWIW
jgi:hypothetical protein